MGQALGEQAASSLHGSNKGSPCFSTSSAQPWWDLGLLAPTLSLESHLSRACRHTLHDASGSSPRERGLVSEGTSGCSMPRELETHDLQLCLWLAQKAAKNSGVIVGPGLQTSAETAA